MNRYVFSLFCAVCIVGCSNQSPDIDGVWYSDTERTLRDIESAENPSEEELAGYRKLFEEANLVLSYKAGVVGVQMYDSPVYWHQYRVVSVGPDYLALRGNEIGDVKAIFYDNCYKVQQPGRDWFEHFCKAETAAHVAQ